MPAANRRSTVPTAPVPDYLEDDDLLPAPSPLGGVLLATLALLLVLALVVPGGTIGQFLRGAIGFGFGWASYLLPVVVGAFAATSIRQTLDPEYRISRLERPGWIILFVTLSAFLQIVGGNPEPTWSRGAGGGLLGKLVWTGFEGGFGSDGGAALIGLIALIGLTLTLRVGVSDLWQTATRCVDLVRRGVMALGKMSRNVSTRSAVSVVFLIRSLRRPPRQVRLAPAEDDSAYAEEPLLSPPRPRSPTRPLPAPAALAEASSPGWELPPISFLRAGSTESLSQTELSRKVRVIEETLADFDVYAKVVSVNPGPTVTQFGLEPGFRERRDRHGEVVKREKIKVSEIMALQNDLQLALAAPSVRVEAPVPGRQVVGLEVPNGQTTVVTMRQVIESTAFQKLRAKSKLALALGEDVSGQPVAADLARAPHLLIAGATGSGKSICINAIISCLLLHATPDEVRLILVDPKRVEMTAYNDVPHLLRPVVVEVDKVVGVLKWVVKEMDDRYKLFEHHGVRNIEGYNRLATTAPPLEGVEEEERPPQLKPLPFIVVIIDELADLMMLAPDDTERLICRLAQLARATGIHLVVATQRPSVDVITGLIKANFPTRISFAVTSQIDSRTILDMPGAEKLLGRGDMLFMPTDAAKPYRLQGVHVAEEEIDALTTHWRTLGPTTYVEQLVQVSSQDEEDEGDDLYEKAVQLAHEHTRISTSLLQRRLRVGYTRAARLMDLLEQKGVVGPAEGGGRSREVNYEQRTGVE